MRNRVLSLFMIVVVAMLLVSCNNNAATTEETSEPQPTLSVESSAPSESDAESSDTEASSIAAEVESATEHETVENAALQGEWVKTKRENKASEKLETIYWRVVSHSTDSKDAIKEYNEDDSHIREFEELENKNLTYYILDYEVYYPEDYTERDSGILSYSIPLNATNPDGNSYEVDGVQYVGLGACHDLEIVPEEQLRAGQVYRGRAIYAMLVPEPRYYFDYSYVDGEKTVHSYISLDTVESQSKIQPR